MADGNKSKIIAGDITIFLALCAFIMLPNLPGRKFTTEPILHTAPTASATPLTNVVPGSEVIPIGKMGETYPWLTLDKSARPATYFFYFNLRKTPFNNVLVRQAFSASIDRDALVKAARELGIKDPYPATTFTPAETLGRDLYNAVGIRFDPLHARQLLNQAGYSDASKFPAITLLIGVSDTDIPGYHEKMAEMVIGMWEKHLGIKVKVEKLEFNAFADRIFTDPPAIFRSIFFPGQNDPHDFMSAFVTKAKYNLGGYEKSDYDWLVQHAQNAKPPLVRQVEYIQAEKMLTEEDTVILPVYHLTYKK